VFLIDERVWHADPIPSGTIRGEAALSGLGLAAIAEPCQLVCRPQAETFLNAGYHFQMALSRTGRNLEAGGCQDLGGPRPRFGDGKRLDALARGAVKHGNL